MQMGVELRDLPDLKQKNCTGMRWKPQGSPNLETISIVGHRRVERGCAQGEKPGDGVK
jgi:hypothetical protein